ncbi:RidA family protein [Syntrophomonas palmitatica]|uniref:RidA family protein n=1 Tax=Syntrophomonas palmitatica TaxID=402877 RepID=UPI0006D0A226|nr:RidA family protein [Syntrophomonas palmitatica]
MNIEKRIEELGIFIPAASKPVAAYVPGVVAGDLLFISGQLPVFNGKLLYSGRAGQDLSLEDGQAAARTAVINCLAVLKDQIESWDNLVRVIKITGFVQSADSFHEQHLIINGASQLLLDIFGDRGRHSRAAVGVNALPLNAACEIEMICQIKR